VDEIKVKCLSIIAKIAEIVAAITIVGTAYLAITSYWDELDQRKKTYTFEVASRYDTSELIESRLALLEEIQVAQIEAGQGSMDQSSLGLFFYKVDILSTQSSNLDSALLKISLFFDSAAACAEAGLCDRVLLNFLLNRDADAIACIFGQRIDRIAATSNLPNIGYGLKKIGSGVCGV